MPFGLKLKKKHHYNVASNGLYVICVELLDSSIVECTLSVTSSGWDCLDNVCQRLNLEQLKADVAEGRLRCTLEEAIPLAAYSLQAEFADYDPERHSVSYLRDFVLVPRHLVTESQRTAVTEAVARQYAALQGISQGLAECCYLLGAQKLDGYGQECFLAKNEANQEVLVAASLHGVLVRRSNTEALVHYRWDDIVNLVNQKRTFGIECQEKERNVTFTFESSDAARYVWRLCVLQHTFFKQNLQNLEDAGALNVDLSKLSLVPDTADSLHGPRPCLHSVCSPVNEHQIPLHSYEEKHMQLQRDAQSLLLASAQGVQRLVHDPGVNMDETSIPAPSVQGRAHPRPQHDVEHLRSLLPAYRKAPDYATALVQKYGPIMAEHFLRSTSMPAEADCNRNDMNYYRGADNKIIYLDKDPNMLQQIVGKPPPPYPFGKINSYSSPNLAFDYQISSSYPNLVGVGNSQPHYHHLRMPSSSVGHLPAIGNNKPPYQHRVHHESQRTYENISNLVNSIGSEVVHSSPQIFKTEDVEVSVSQVLAPHLDLEESREPIYQNLPTRGILLQKQGNMPKWAQDHLSQSEFLAPAESLEQIPPELSWPQQAPPLKPVSKDSLLQALVNRMSSDQLHLEFELIPKRKPHADFATAAHSENAPRNRYTDILPYEENRIRLTPSRENRFGYINASHISGSIGGLQKFYIAAQAPLFDTVSAFWQSIWESDVRIVILLCEIEQQNTNVKIPPQNLPSVLLNRFSFGRSSSGRNQHTASNQTSSSSLGTVAKETCTQYWPMIDMGTMDFGDFRVTKIKSFSSMVCQVVQLSVKNIQSGAQRTIWHLHFTLWTEGGLPTSPESLIALSEELESIRKMATVAESPDKPVYSYNRNRPVYVQCATGVGRAGVFILFDILRHSIDFNSDVDVSKMLLHLRQQRMNFVPALGQYRAVYQALVNYLKGSRLI
ncbi:tyrosine-protein phosphatase non-receptor type 21-like isoform X2 [Artemia franciscana]|uniref:tyrosine-protein phosphatase non-receptor type 21-like isoform X2 n=1 Tax=Artemia franciscana TaxID=6661 RepID=UPI0032D9C2A0